MRRRRPPDVLLLAALAERGRNVAPNLAHHTGKSRKNVNARLPVLADDGLVDTVGPVEHFDRYELTDLGETGLVHRDRYGEVDDRRLRGRSRLTRRSVIACSSVSGTRLE